MIEKIKRSPVVNIEKMTFYESNVCTGGGCSLRQRDHNLLEDAGMRLDQLDREIKKGATIDRVPEDTLHVSQENIEDTKAYA